MSDDELAFLGKICETPDCDVPRLVYADWLDENGQAERAEFIRLQISNHGKPADGRDREVAFAHDNRDRWFPSGRWEFSIFSINESWENRSMLIVRGFVGQLTCTLAEFMDHRCWGCEGSGRPFVPIQDVTGAIRHEHVQCNRCHGTGTLPGLARALFGTHPITRVVLTCREPWDATGLVDLVGDRQAWRWLLHQNVNARRDQIPTQIYHEMIGMEDRESLSYLEFSSRESALSALSLAAVNYARKLHGYTPLPALLEPVG